MTLPAPVALVTGGGGGIGAAIAREFAGRGHQVVVADLDPEAAGAVAEAVGGSAVAVDVTDFEANRSMVEQVLRHYGRLDVVALNAGVNSGISPGDPLDLEKYRRANAVNLDGVVFGIDAARDGLALTGGGILVTASLAALAPTFSNPVYTLAKSAVVGYVRAMATPLSRLGITINAVCPAFVDTTLLGKTRPVLAEQGFPILAPAEVAAALGALLDSGGTGQVWAMVAGRPPVPYEYPEIPATLHADGSVATLTL